jgi:sulfide:quinone oxidoreductase
MARTLILGAGFGGITVSSELDRLLGGEHEVVLVDRGEGFSMGLRKLRELVDLGTIAEGTRSRQRLSAKGTRFVLGEVSAIDPGARSAVCDGEALEADYLVVALGADARPDLVPGLGEHGYDAWETAGIPPLKEALERFDGGRLAVVIAGAPYPCPPAPYELAMLLDEWLRARGLREGTELSVTTVQPMLMPNAGKEGSAWVGEQLRTRGIEFQAARKVERVEEGRVVLADGELEFDLLIGVPPHRPPAVVADSGLGGEGGWVKVDHGTLETGQPGVFAIGDVTQIKLANGLPMVKAGVIAEREGERVAAAIAADVGGAGAPPPFDGTGFCFLEAGSGAAAIVEGDFFAEPEPRVTIAEPSAEGIEGKHRFESERLERWFAPEPS